MSQTIHTQPLTAKAFAPYGDVLKCDGAPDKIINGGMCGRFHDLAIVDVEEGRTGISLFQSKLRQLPYRLELVERHPIGSQAFIPMSMDPFLVIVADADMTPHAFITAAGEGINFHKGTWHGVLTPLSGTGLFAVVDRICDEPNLEEYRFAEPYIVAK